MAWLVFGPAAKWVHGQLHGQHLQLLHRCVSICCHSCMCVCGGHLGSPSPLVHKPVKLASLQESQSDKSPGLSLADFTPLPNPNPSTPNSGDAFKLYSRLQTDETDGISGLFMTPVNPINPNPTPPLNPTPSLTQTPNPKLPNSPTQATPSSSTPGCRRMRMTASRGSS